MMKAVFLVPLLLSVCDRTFGFIVKPETSRTADSSRLFISSWGTKGPPAYQTDTARNPEKYVQDYLPEPQAVEARDNVDGTVLVSGVCNAKERTDQFLFDLLNHEESAFGFDKIVAFVDDTAFAKKRLLSRSARYTGLLDKLDFTAAATAGALPTLEDLDSVKSWLAVVDDLSTCKEIAGLAASAASVENVAILLTDATELEVSACQDVVDSLNDSGKAFTVVAVGSLHDGPEGEHAYHFGVMGEAETTLPATTTFSREEAYRLVTELLQLECGKSKALMFAELYNVNATETRLIKGLREAGYARPQEIDHMIREGPDAYKAAVEEWKTKHPDSELGYTTEAWWEADEFKKSRERSDARAAAKLETLKDARTVEIETLAKEWAKREFFHVNMEGKNNNLTEEEYTESVWDRAMKEGELAYRKKMGELTDDEADAELADFQARQARKQETMLKKAKQDLAELLDEDNLFDEDDDKEDKK